MLRLVEECVWAGICTWFSHFGDVHSLFRGHEAQDGEDHKAGKEAGAAVNQGQNKSIPAYQDKSNVSDLPSALRLHTK